MLLFPYALGNAFLEEEYTQKIIQLMNEVVRRNGIRVRILTSKDIQEKIEKLTARQKIIMIKSEQQEDGRGLVVGEKGKFEVHLIDPNQQQQRLQTRVSFLIVDSKVSLIEESRPYIKNNKIPELSLATYSNNESMILTYISIFETLWAQNELKIKKLNKSQP